MLEGWLIYPSSGAPTAWSRRSSRRRTDAEPAETAPGRAGWTQEQLGQALGVSRQAVNALETEKHDPSLDLAYRIAVLFARPVEDIFENPSRLTPSGSTLQGHRS
jgi:putative transcriptional regulator